MCGDDFLRRLFLFRELSLEELELLDDDELDLRFLRVDSPFSSESLSDFESRFSP